MQSQTTLAEPIHLVLPTTSTAQPALSTSPPILSSTGDPLVPLPVAKRVKKKIVLEVLSVSNDGTEQPVKCFIV